MRSPLTSQTTSDFSRAKAGLLTIEASAVAKMMLFFIGFIVHPVGIPVPTIGLYGGKGHEFYY
jgi:hypothetical protein